MSFRPPYHNPLPQLVPTRLDRLRRVVEGEAWTRQQPLAVAGTAVTFGEAGPVPDDAPALRYEPVDPGSFFGPAKGGWARRWFRLSVPAARDAEHDLRHLIWDCQGKRRHI